MYPAEKVKIFHKALAFVVRVLVLLFGLGLLVSLGSFGKRGQVPFVCSAQNCFGVWVDRNGVVVCKFAHLFFFGQSVRLDDQALLM